MGREIVWSEQADNQLFEILDYWEERNSTKTYSVKLYKMIQDCLKQLARFPESGRKVDYKEVRYRIVKDYFIYYKYNNTKIMVVAICDMRRAPEFIQSLI